LLDLGISPTLIPIFIDRQQRIRPLYLLAFDTPLTYELL
jgi:hypothetical protein